MAKAARHVFTSESVTEGHPDKVADQISDAVLDAILIRDPGARVACETLVTTGMAVVAGEITTATYVHIPDIVRDTIREIGYTDAAFGFDSQTCAVLSSIDRQSPDIARGVDDGEGKAQGAGDQGMMFGYATDETRERMPLPIMLAHRMAERLAAVRKGTHGLDRIDWLRPDGKTQVSVEYEGDRPVGVRTVVLSTQHADKVGRRELSQATIRQAMVEHVVRPVLDAAGIAHARTRFLINPTGRFVIGGPHGDAGLTGRKIIVDTYGGMARHGGGAFSGKDPSKVDRSAAYAAPPGGWPATSWMPSWPGVARSSSPTPSAWPSRSPSWWIPSAPAPDAALERAVRQVFDLTPGGIIKALKLKRPIYRPSAAYGHFGRKPVTIKVAGKSVDLFPWERTDRVAQLQRALR